MHGMLMTKAANISTQACQQYTVPSVIIERWKQQYIMILALIRPTNSIDVFTNSMQGCTMQFYYVGLCKHYACIFLMPNKQVAFLNFRKRKQKPNALYTNHIFQWKEESYAKLWKYHTAYFKNHLTKHRLVCNHFNWCIFRVDSKYGREVFFFFNLIIF